MKDKDGKPPSITLLFRPMTVTELYHMRHRLDDEIKVQTAEKQKKKGATT